MLIEYIPCGDLLGFLRKSRGLKDNYYKNPDIKPKTTLTSQQLMQFAWQIADGMEFLSSNKVMAKNERFCMKHQYRAFTIKPDLPLTNSLKARLDNTLLVSVAASPCSFLNNLYSPSVN